MTAGLLELSGLELLLAQVKEQEASYDWRGAATSYRKIVGNVPKNDLSPAGPFYEQSAYASYRAAMQAQNAVEFKDRIRYAIADYENAKQIYQMTGKPDRIGKVLRCDAMVAYLGYWLEDDASEKKRLLGESWKLTKDSLKVFEESRNGESYGKTFNLLWTSALLRSYYEWSFENFAGILTEAAVHGEKAIAQLSALGESIELAEAYVSTSGWVRWIGALLIPDVHEKDKYFRKASDYWTRARKLSDEASLRVALWEQGITEAGFGSAAVLDFFRRALEMAKRQRDRLLAGLALEQLAFHLYWKAQGVDDPDEIAHLIEESVDYSKDAEREFSSILFKSPGCGPIWSQAPPNECYLTLARYEIDSKKKLDLLQDSRDAGQTKLRQAESSGYPFTIASTHHELSKTFAALAEMETRPEEKKNLLEEALRHRNEYNKIYAYLYPQDLWNLGLSQNYLANLKSSLAHTANDSEAKVKLLEDAVAAKAACLRLCNNLMPWFDKRGSLPQIAWVGERRLEYGDLWNSISDLAKDPTLLWKAIQSFENAGESFRKLNLPSRVAECHWKAARAYDALGDHLKSSEAYIKASNSYGVASEKISQLRDLYQDQSSYMQAWNWIEKARYHHDREEYDLAKECYETTVGLFHSSRRWNYLVSNYSALAQAEHAENLSRTDLSQDAIPAFKQAAELFSEAKTTLQAKLGEIESAYEIDVMTGLIQGADLRGEYCSGRVVLEEAKILDRAGDHRSSSLKYGEAAKKFQTAAETLGPESGLRQLKLVASLARAWQMMSRAEEETSPEFYQEASGLFEKAKEFCANEDSKSLTLGHAHFCKALEAGMRFADTGNRSHYLAAQKQLEIASKYYLRGQLREASYYAEATERLFDAYLNMREAKKEKDPEKKARQYRMIEKILQESAQSFLRARHGAKREQVLRLLEKVKKEREFAMSLADLMRAPTFLSSTRSFSPPASTRESAIGLERFEHSEIQVNLKTSEKTLNIGEELAIELKLVNAGRSPAQLVKVEEIIPEGFELTEKPRAYGTEDSYLNMRGKLLGPLKMEEVRLVLKAKIGGQFLLRPRILYVDENGRYKSHEPEPVKVVVGELSAQGQPPAGLRFEESVASEVSPISPVLRYLAEAFVADYMVKRLTLERAGWRSLTDIVDSLNVPKSRVYGNPSSGHTFGKPLESLVKAGIVEHRIVLGARGRGGKVMKVRIAYEKEPVKRLVNEMALIPLRNE